MRLFQPISLSIRNRSRASRSLPLANWPMLGTTIALLFLACPGTARSWQLAAIPDATQASSQLPATPAPPALAASIRGIVVDRDGAVYQGVQISLTGPAPDKSVQSVQSDTNGRFLFENLHPGQFQLSFSAPGFATQTFPSQLHERETLELPPVTLLVTGTTTDVQVNASQQEIAQEQLHVEEQQRIFGAIPNFYVVYDAHPAPLNARQKFHLAWRTSIDPFTFLSTGFFAGLEQAANTFSAYGPGARGYAKRYAAGYADGFIDTMIGSALLPSLLKQDPRYYYKGTGTIRSRVLYALANSVICKGDNGHWQFNYSGILGGAAAGGISNLYYPAGDRNGIGLTLENTALGIAGGAVQNLFQEFLVRKLTPKARSTQLQP